MSQLHLDYYDTQERDKEIRRRFFEHLKTPETKKSKAVNAIASELNLQPQIVYKSLARILGHGMRVRE